MYITKKQSWHVLARREYIKHGVPETTTRPSGTPNPSPPPPPPPHPPRLELECRNQTNIILIDIYFFSVLQPLFLWSDNITWVGYWGYHSCIKIQVPNLHLIARWFDSNHTTWPWRLHASDNTLLARSKELHLTVFCHVYFTILQLMSQPFEWFINYHPFISQSDSTNATTRNVAMWL